MSTPPALVDTHCHLNTGELAADADAAWERARAAGVGRAVVVGIDRAHSEATLAFCAEREGLFPTAGLHPCHVHEAVEGDWERVAELARRPEVVGIGESGLDLFHDQSTLPAQVDSLHRHAELALELDKPLILHVRDAFPALREALAPYAGRGLRAILHCFGGEPEDLDPWLDWGFLVSFAGIITYKKAENVRQSAERVPLAQCLVETDAPWLAPVPYRGKRNEPAYVVSTAERLAEVKGLSLEELARVTSENAARVFRLPSD